MNGHTFFGLTGAVFWIAVALYISFKAIRWAVHDLDRHIQFEPDEVPNWVCSSVVDGVEYSGVGKTPIEAFDKWQSFDIAGQPHLQPFEECCAAEGGHIPSDFHDRQ